jgi:hypothetical protein
VIEPDRHERMSKVMQPDLFDPVTVQARTIARDVNGAKQVPPRLGLAAHRRKNTSASGRTH